MKTFAMGAVALLTVIIAIVLSTHEPRYQGRTLTSWLQQCFDTPLMETQRLTEAQDAVRAIGAKKALPKLLKLVQAEDDPVSLWIIDAGDKLRISDVIGLRFIRWHSAGDFWWLGERGFEVLGTNAAPAAESLEKLLDKEGRLLVIGRCLESIGKPAEPVICQSLTNRDPAVRQWAIDGLALVTDDVEVYIARIKARLQDASSAVRGTAVDAVGMQTSAPELAVPLLVEALKDPVVGAKAINALASFGTNALVAFPILTNLVEHGDSNMASAALVTLIAIASDKAFPIFTNYLAEGKPNTDAALQALAQAMPDKALPIILARLQSPDVKIRRRALGLLFRYPETSQIDAVIRTVATGSDRDLALAAKGFLTRQYEASHPDAVLFPDDPIYNGRRLGDWLISRTESAELTPAAKAAIQEAGTNAIPALMKRLTYVRPPYCFNAPEININATWGFIALGELAKPALPELWLLMDDTNEPVAMAALIASFGTGSNAMPFVVKGLTNQFAGVRSTAAALFTEDVGDKFPEQRKSAMPSFIKLLSDPDYDMRLNATNQLKQIDPTVAASVGIK